METISFKKGQLIFLENSPGEEMFVVRSGKVGVFKIINAEKIELAVLGRNDFFGEMCLLLGCPRSASVEALEDTELLVLTRDTFRQSIQSDPTIAEKMVNTMARRLLQADSIISKLEGEKRSLEIIYGSH